MNDSRRLLVLTRRRANASFRQRIEAYLGPLAARGIASEVVELAACPMARRRQLLRAREFDAVWLHRKTLTAWDAWALRGAARPMIYDVDDAVMYQARTAERGPHPGRLRRFRRTVAMARLTLAGNPILADHVARAGGRAEVVPTGLDAGRYPPKEQHENAGPLKLVWIGSRSTLKRLDPFRDMFAELARSVPGVVLRVIADAEFACEGLTVENVPWSREAEARLLAECDVGVAPLPDTPFTRGKCAFKVLQCMAAGLPVIASPVGANADYVRDGETGLHALTINKWVAAVGRLAADAGLRESMGRAGRRRVADEFDVAVLAPRVVDLIDGAIAG